MTVYNQYNSPGLAVRFWEKVDQSGECWLWTGTVSIGGRYGAIRVEGKMRPAHRVAYELEVGPIPIGLELDHLCRTPRCVRPSHLEPVTHQENVRRGSWGARAMSCRLHGPKDRVAGGFICRECRREANERYRRRLGALPAGTRNVWDTRTPERRAEISRKIWATRRRNAVSA